MHESIRIPQVSIDSTGLIMARPDSFVPATDVFAGEQYIIYMDVPGMTSEDIDIYR
jgi:HSP20 family molecular chaperone IbpA